MVKNQFKAQEIGFLGIPIWKNVTQNNYKSFCDYVMCLYKHKASTLFLGVMKNNIN